MQQRATGTVSAPSFLWEFIVTKSKRRDLERDRSKRATSDCGVRQSPYRRCQSHRLYRTPIFLIIYNTFLMLSGPACPTSLGPTTLLLSKCQSSLSSPFFCFSLLL